MPSGFCFLCDQRVSMLPGGQLVDHLSGGVSCSGSDLSPSLTRTIAACSALRRPGWRSGGSVTLVGHLPE